MGKAKRQKAHQREKPLFPFKLLQYWIKPLRPGSKICSSCAGRATFVCENYVDIDQVCAHVDDGMESGRALNLVWSKALAAQCQGRYPRHGTTHLCHECTALIVTLAIGKQGALFSLHKALTEHLSLIIGCEYKTPQDDRLMFALVLTRSVSTIEQVSRLLKEKSVSITSLQRSTSHDDNITH